MDELLTILGAVIVFVLIIFGILFAIAYPLALSQCNSQWSSFEHRYGLIEGCMIKVKNHWIPESAYREIK